ncbi:hypothetical protein QF117_09245 [Vibrio sp. YMD68]|uniref:hypothetical protein n=1 Tax=Vibrio sp. YMD68 TaxID=3042300 RepID=UPI00249C3EE3|nr:hypothetical protein [Vibrio sp. YMD68]WGW00332.1 hypothetical protein QF117_21130 [Vibrio sp. YMD68]WGW00987.1 hypothetical protein QF117_09245 [Vibrio sp. YMD68]
MNINKLQTGLTLTLIVMLYTMGLKSFGFHLVDLIPLTALSCTGWLFWDERSDKQ